MIQLDAVTKRYGDAYAVRSISMTVEAEQTTVLIGPSGSGKSTLLRLMIGLTPPDAGSVTVKGKQLTRTNVQSIRHRMGYVIQEGGLFPHLTGRANAALLARHLGWSEDRIDTRIEELTQLVQLVPDRLSQYPSELSGGQRQRVSLMRARPRARRDTARGGPGRAERAASTRRCDHRCGLGPSRDDGPGGRRWPGP